MTRKKLSENEEKTQFFGDNFHEIFKRTQLLERFSSYLLNYYFKMLHKIEPNLDQIDHSFSYFLKHSGKMNFYITQLLLSHSGSKFSF